MIFIPKRPKLAEPPGILVHQVGNRVVENRYPVMKNLRTERTDVIRKFFRRRDRQRRKMMESYAYTVRGSEALTTQQAAGTNFTTYTTAKRVINDQAALQLPQGDAFWYIGKTLRVTCVMGVSNRSTATNDTMTFQVQLGTAGATTVFTSGAVNLTTSAHTTIPGHFQCWLTVRALGSGTAANMIGQSILSGQMFSVPTNTGDNAAGTGQAMGPNTAPAVGGGFDTTVSNLLDFFVAQSVSSSSNGVQVQIYIVEALN